MNAIEEMLRTEIRAAYIEGKSGKSCAVWPPLAREASAQEITRTAEKIAGQLAELPELAGVSLGQMVIMLKGYMMAWQAGARSEKRGDLTKWAF